MNHQYQIESLKNYIDTNMMLYEARIGGLYSLSADIENGSMPFEEHNNFAVLCCDKLKAIPSILKYTGDFNAI